MNLLRTDTTEKIAYLIPKPGKSRDDVKALFSTDGDWNTFAAGTSTFLTKHVWYGFFGVDDSWMTYDYAQSEAEMLEEEGLITGLKFCPTFCLDDIGKDLKDNYKCVVAFRPAIETVLTFKIDKEKKDKTEIQKTIWGAAEAVMDHARHAHEVTRSHVSERERALEEFMAKKLLEHKNEIEKKILESAKKTAKQQNMIMTELEEQKRQRALATAEPAVGVLVTTSIDEEQAQDETKEPEGPVPDKKAVGRLDMPKVTEFLTKKKDPKTPLEKAVTIEPAVATPLSEASFGEKGDGSTPPPAPVQGAAKRVLELMNPPKGTPVVAQQLGKENADGAVSKLKAFVTSFGVKTEPGAKA